MWKEIITIEGFNELSDTKKIFGCNADISGAIFLRNTQVKTDCHYFHYKSDIIELIKGYKQNGDIIELIVYTIKADIKDYPEAIRLMGEQAKEYLKKREIKRIRLGSGYSLEDIIKMESANAGVRKIGFIKFVDIVKEEYGKLGFNIIFNEKELIKELI